MYKCAPNIDPKERYSYISNKDSYGNYIVSCGRNAKGRFGIVNAESEYIVTPIYRQIGGAKNGQYIAA